MSILAERSGAHRGVIAPNIGGRIAPGMQGTSGFQGCALTTLVVDGAGWTLSISANTLASQGEVVSLTQLETLILEELVRSWDGVVSKERIIVRLGRDAEHYSGLEMCMSRLQRKFKRHFGQQRLFVAVRNRGYRLTQRIWVAE